MTPDDMIRIRHDLGMSQQEFAQALAAIPLRRIGGCVGDLQKLNLCRINEYESGRRNPGPLVKLAVACLAKDRKIKLG